MEDGKQYLENLTEIRSIMERSSKFLSLSGLAGVAVGVVATIAGLIAFYGPRFGLGDYLWSRGDFSTIESLDSGLYYLLLAVITLVAAIGSAFFFTRHKARKRNLPIWNKTAKRLLIDMAVPLIAGGVFVLIQVFYYQIISLAAPTMLVFYGLALFSASKYTVNDTRWLGMAEICLGLAGLFFLGYGLLFWLVGFGVLHILYGTVLYFKYDWKV